MQAIPSPHDVFVTDPEKPIDTGPLHMKHAPIL